MSEKNPTTEPVISARSLDLVGSTEAAVEPSARGRYRAARNKLIDRGMATAEYAVGILMACQTSTHGVTSQDSGEIDADGGTDSVPAWMTRRSPRGALPA